MSEEKVDRRIQRTRQLLRDALMQLVQEKGYDTVTIQDITERANLGRTTFYLHYQSKDDLLLDHHADFTAHLNLETLSRDQLMSAEPQPEMIAFLRQIDDGKNIYFAFTRAKDADIIMRGIQQQMAAKLLGSLDDAFPGQTPSIAPDVLANYIIGAQLSLIDWWVSNRTPYDATQIATMMHRLQRAAICDAYAVE